MSYDTIEESVTWTEKLCGQLNLARVARNKKIYIYSTPAPTSVQVQDPRRQFGRKKHYRGNYFFKSGVKCRGSDR